MKDFYLISSDNIIAKDGYLDRYYKMNGYFLRFLQVRSR